MRKLTVEVCHRYAAACAMHVVVLLHVILLCSRFAACCILEPE